MVRHWGRAGRGGRARCGQAVKVQRTPREDELGVTLHTFKYGLELGIVRRDRRRASCFDRPVDGRLFPAKRRNDDIKGDEGLIGLVSAVDMWTVRIR